MAADDRPRGSSPPALARIPSLDEITAQPELLKALPREMLADLALRAGIAYHAAMVALQLAAAPGPLSDPETLVSSEEVAKIFGVSVSTIQHKAKQPPYSYFLVPGTRPYRFSRSKIDRYIRQHAGRTEPEPRKLVRRRPRPVMPEVAS